MTTNVTLNTNFLSYIAGSQKSKKSKMDLAGLKSRYWQSFVPFQKL